MNILLFLALKELYQPRRMRELVKTKLNKSTVRVQFLLGILEGCFYLFKSQPSFDS